MPRTSSKKTSKSEAEEAEWLSSPAGRSQTSREFRRAFSRGVIVNSDPSTLEADRAEARRTGKVVLAQKGMGMKSTDPAVLQKLYDDAVAKITQPVSLRIPVADIELAKAIAKKQGVGYQAVLKGIISKGVRRAS